MLKLIILNSFFIYIFFSSFAFANNIVALDGDSLFVYGVETRMYGIDAPEYDQFCFDENEKKYPCGEVAKKKLKSLITDKTICIIKGHDKYNRILTVCYNGNIDINKELVRSGTVVAYSRYTADYIEEEKQAKEKKIGLWRGKFIYPEKYRIINKK